MSTVATHIPPVSWSSTKLPSLAPWATLTLFCGVLFFPGLGDRDLTSSHEARAAQNAQMILDEGHWLVPRLFDRHLELQKPPLYYWLVAAIAWIKGGPVDAWAVRLPAALSALGCVLFLYYLGIRSGRALAGLLAALVLASSLHFTWLARVGRIDMPLTFVVTVTLGAFYLGQGEHSRRWLALGYSAMGIGLLLKGPIALVLPCVVIVPVAFYLGAIRSSLASLWWGVPLMLAIAAPWYVWANVRTDNQLWEVFFWYHNVERGLGGSETLKGYPWWYYGPQAAFGLLPWSLAVPAALLWFVRKREVRADVPACCGLIWFGAIAAFLSCMSFKRADYLLPAYPGMAIFLGVVAERWWSEPRGSSPSSSRAIASLFCILCAYAIGWQVYLTCIATEDHERPYQTMAEEIRSQTNGPVIFFRAESHVLMHHVGPPVDTILEWENLQWWVERPRTIFIVMPAACVDECQERLPHAALTEVLRTTDYANGKRDRALVVLRTP